ECPVPEKQVTYLRRESNPDLRQAMASPDFLDERLQFGSCSIGRGKAFAIENDAIAQAHASVEKSVPVGKELATIEGKVWLIESVEYSALKPFLDTLEMAAVAPRRKELVPPPSGGGKSKAASIGGSTQAQRAAKASRPGDGRAPSIALARSRAQ